MGGNKRAGGGNGLFELIERGAPISLREVRSALCDLEKRLHLAEDLGHFGLWDLDLASGRGSYDPALRELCGLERDHASYGEFLAAVHPEDRERAESAMKRALDEGAAYELELRLIRADDGSIRWFETKAVIERDCVGRPLRCRGLAIDVTERKEQELSLRNMQRGQRFLARAAAALSESLDHRETLRRAAGIAIPLFADACTVDLLDEGGDLERVARTPHHLNGTGFSLAPAGGIHRAEETEEPEATALRARAPQLCSEIPLGKVLGSAIAVPILVRGRLVGALGFYSATPGRYGEGELDLAVDLARRAACAIDHSFLYQDAREAVRARDEFLSVASHELRNPLAALALAVQTAQRAAAVERGATLERALGVADRQLERLARLVEQLLDVSRIRAGRLQLDLEEVDLRDVVHGATQPFMANAGGESELRLRLAREPVVGHWDGVRLGQIVVNLVQNAIKFGRGEPIDIAVEQRGDRAVLVVQDRGVGIPPEQLPRIFGRFERAASSRNYGGLGLGLYIVSSIVRAHGGELTAESEPGVGSTFTVSLPLQSG